MQQQDFNLIIIGIIGFLIIAAAGLIGSYIVERRERKNSEQESRNQAQNERKNNVECKYTTRWINRQKMP